MTPGDRLRLARIAANHRTIASACGRFGWNRATVSAHERNQNGISPALAKEYGRAYRVDPTWILFGDGTTPVALSTPEPADFVAIPRRDVRLSAGDGAVNLDDAPVLDDIPFTREFLRDRLGRSHMRGLVMVKAAGDSMEPTIGDGDLVMVDTDQRELSPGIFAALRSGEAIVKRLARAGRGVSIISDNPAYPVEHVSGDALADLIVLGRVRWIGRVLG